MREPLVLIRARAPSLSLLLSLLVAACEPGVEAAVDAAMVDAPSGPDPGTTPDHVRYRGQLAATPAVTFGGGTYCTYSVSLRDVVFDVVLRGTEQLATMRVEDTVTETIIGTCPYTPQPDNRQRFAHAGGALTARSDGSFEPVLIGLSTNAPTTTATSLVTQVGDGTLDVTARWERTDQAPPLKWIVMTAAPVRLQPSACEVGGLVCVDGTSEGVLYTCADGLRMSPVKRCPAGCAPSQLACN